MGHRESENKRWPYANTKPRADSEKLVKLSEKTEVFRTCATKLAH